MGDGDREQKTLRAFNRTLQPLTCSVYTLQQTHKELAVKFVRLRSKVIILAAVSLLPLPRSFPQQTQPQNKPAAPAATDPSAGVEVTAQALAPTKFCALGPNAYVMYVPLDITVANGRRTPIILTRYLHIQRLLVGKTTDDIFAQKYELATPVRTYRSFGEGVSFGPQPNDDSFVVLKHNQTFELTAVQGIPVRNNVADKIPGTAYPGSLAMSIELQTWPFNRSASSMQTTWAKFGDLISTPVVSYPTLIQLPANPPTEKCGLLGP